MGWIYGGIVWWVVAGLAVERVAKDRGHDLGLACFLLGPFTALVALIPKGPRLTIHVCPECGAGAVCRDEK